MKKGQIIAIKQGFGNIELARFHSKYNNKSFNVYLRFNMSTEHKVIESYEDLIDIEKVLNILKENK